MSAPTLPHVYIPSHGRAESITTHRLLGDIPHTIVVNSAEQALLYAAAAPRTGLDPARLLVCPQERPGQQIARQLIVGLTDPGQWHVQVDDDLAALCVVPEPFYGQSELPVRQEGEGKTWRSRYATPADPGQIGTLLRQWVYLGDQTGAEFVGPASNDNFFFRAKHWRTVGFIPGTLFAFKRGRLRFPAHNGIEDMYMTGLQLEAHGRVLIDNYAYPDAGHYVNPGGTMAYDGAWRVERRRRDYADIMARFPGLWRQQDKPAPECVNLTMRLHSPAQIATWRTALRAHRAAGSRIQKGLPQ